MINLAGKPKDICDEQCRKELEEAGIPIFPHDLGGGDGEVKTSVFGFTAIDNQKFGNKRQPHWIIKRAWYYWVATLQLPSRSNLTMEQAMELHAKHGKVVRADGHCGAPSPEEAWGADGIPYLYHIDTQEGLNAFAKAILE